MAHQTPTQRHDAPQEPDLRAPRLQFVGIVAGIAVAACALGLGVANASAGNFSAPEAEATAEAEQPAETSAPVEEPVSDASETSAEAATDAEETPATDDVTEQPAATPAPLAITDVTQASFPHGDKPASATRYIVLHDTRSAGTAADVVASWRASNDGAIASHFVIDRDGAVLQCVPMDQIAYHAGVGDDGAKERFGVTSMNSASIGIELAHADGEDYPEAQLGALDQLIAHIDDWAGAQCEIIDHKMWRSSNVDTSEQFSDYLTAYRTNRTHTV